MIPTASHALAALMRDHITRTDNATAARKALVEAEANLAAAEMHLRQAVGDKTVGVRNGPNVLLVWFDEDRLHTRDVVMVEEGAAPAAVAETKTETPPAETEAKRGRGRPPGAPNKSKETAAATTPPAGDQPPAAASEGAAPATTTAAGVETKTEAPAAPAKVKTCTQDEFRAFCRKHSSRLGNSAPIMALLGEKGVAGVKPEDYASLMVKIEALQPAAV